MKQRNKIVKTIISEEQKQKLEILVSKSYQGCISLSELLRHIIRNFLNSDEVKEFLVRK